MSLSKRLFRESALERLTSPEQLDQQLQVTSPRGWVALLAIWAILGAIVAWSVAGSVPTKEEGQGILVAGGGLKVVGASGTGRLRSIDVEVKQVVRKGQGVASIDLPDVADQLEETRALLDERRRKHERINEFDAKEEEIQETLERVELARIDNEIQFLAIRIDRLGKRADTVSGLVERGMMTEIDLFEVQEKIEDAEMARDRLHHDKERLVASNREATFGRHRDRISREGEIEDLELRARNLQEKLDRESTVISPTDGTVVEVRAAENSAVTTGDPIIVIQPRGSDATELEAILYVSAATGKRIHEGMTVHVAPSTVKREEFGSMLGTVSFRAEVPTSRSAMVVDLGDEDLVDQLTAVIGLPLETRVALQPDESTTSGYRWTSSEGPPNRVSAGTLCSGSITVETQRPIELLIPYVRKKLGMD